MSILGQNDIFCGHNVVNHRPESNFLHGLNWSTDHVTTLGVTLLGREEYHYILNFKKRLKIWNNC